MLFDDVNNITCFNFNERYNFRPLREVIGHRKDEPMISSRWRNDRSYDMIPQTLKGHEVTMVWSSSGGWYIKSARI